MEPLKDYISTSEASKRYNISRTHAALLARSGKIAAIRVTGNWLIHVPSLEKYLSNPPKPGLKPGTKLKRKKT